MKTATTATSLATGIACREAPAKRNCAVSTRSPLRPTLEGGLRTPARRSEGAPPLRQSCAMTTITQVAVLARRHERPAGQWTGAHPRTDLGPVRARAPRVGRAVPGASPALRQTPGKRTPRHFTTLAITC